MINDLHAAIPCLAMDGVQVSVLNGLLSHKEQAGRSHPHDDVHIIETIENCLHKADIYHTLDVEGRAQCVHHTQELLQLVGMLNPNNLTLTLEFGLF